MKKMIILAALALMVGIYAFQNESQMSEVPEEQETKVVKRHRSISSIPSHEHFVSESSPAEVTENNYAQNEYDNVNCLNFDGEDVCQNDYSSNNAQDTIAEESFVQAEEAQVAIEEPIPDVVEGTQTDYEGDIVDNNLYAASSHEE